MSFSIEPLAHKISLQPWPLTAEHTPASHGFKTPPGVFSFPPAGALNSVTTTQTGNPFKTASGPKMHRTWGSLASAAATPPNILNFNYFGGDKPSLAAEANAWLWQHGARGDTLVALNQFLETCRSQHFRREHKAVCLVVRIERQNEKFSLPNPHHDGDDGKYWDALPGDGEMFKLGTVLLGPGTIFYDTDDEMAHWAVNQGRKEKYEQGWKEERIRQWLYEGFGPVTKRSLRPGEIGKWKVGNDCKGTIHSEPNMSDMPEGRIFLSLVPGTVQQIQELAKRWNATYEVYNKEILFN